MKSDSPREIDSHARRGIQDLLEQTDHFVFNSILDVGGGTGFAARHFAARGKDVTFTSYEIESYSIASFPKNVRVLPNVDVCDLHVFPNEAFDAVWCSHVLEHVQDIGKALREIRRVLATNGRLFVVVPEYSSKLVGGHVSTGWTIGTLMYNLVVAGFRVKDGAFINHCWNVAASVAKGDEPMRKLRRDKGDLEILADLFPPSVAIHQGLEGNLLRVNWEWHEGIRDRAEKEFDKVKRFRRLKSLIPPALMDLYKRARPYPGSG
jgi:SAM-dependent methyltransferase